MIEIISSWKQVQHTLLFLHHEADNDALLDAQLKPYQIECAKTI